MKTYEPEPGENVYQTALTMVTIATESADTVQAKFNDIELTANPGDDHRSITDYYHKESQRRHDEYVSSPAYKEAQERAEERGRQRDRKLAEALAEAPPAMTLRDKEGWDTCLKANADGYGAAILRYAELWARLMEGEMIKGTTLEDCAIHTSHMADNEGITGFMYGAAVATLAKVWVHGEALRVWHNKEYGVISDKGTVNPAVLTLKPNDN